MKSTTPISPATRRLAAPLAIGLLFVALPASAGAVDERLAETFAASGLRPIAARPPAPDFDLPLLDGDSARLSDYSGRWIVLTFWAAWCGPCRAEMPSLEAVHRQRSGAGVAVLGVALDREAAASRALAAELGLTFPSYHDADGRVAALYAADSIPSSFLIDPAGSVVAQARGARDWRELLPVLDLALEVVPPGDGAAASFATASLRQTEVSRPPSAEIGLRESTPRPGRPFDLVIQLRWAGDFTEYLPHPPAVHLPEGVVQQGVTAETSSRDGRHLVTYQISLLAEEPGRFALDPVELRYTPAGAAEPVATRIAGPTVEVRRSRPGVAELVGGVVAVAALGLLGVVVLRRRRAGGATDSAGSRYERLRPIFVEAKAARLRGDTAGFLRRIAEVEEGIGEIGESESSDLADRLEAVRFGGRAPSSATMDQLQRRAERRLADLRPDPRAARRNRLRLRRAGDA